MRALRLLSTVLCLLVLAACTDAPDADPALSDDPVASAEAPEASPARGGADCLVGTWAVDAEYSFRPEMWGSILPAGSDLSFEYAGSSGQAHLTFASDGAVRQRFDDFEMTIDGDTGVGTVSTTVGFDGTSTGTYTIEGEAIRFVPGEATLESIVRASLGGNEIMNSAMDFESLFETAERSRTTFTCSGDELLLDIHELPEGGRVMFEDARYVRVGS